MRNSRGPLVLLLLALVGFTACGSGGSSIEQAGAAERPVVVATTSILGDVVEQLSGGQFDVVTIMPAGADPHLFQPSARDVAAMEAASAVIANGAAFEEGLLDAIHATEASGVPVLEAITTVAPLAASAADDDHDDHGDKHDDHGDDDHDDHGDKHDDHADDDHDDHGDDDHGDDDHDDHDDDDHDDHDDDDHDDHGDDEHDDHGHDAHEGGVDPHFFTDPARMADAASEIATFLIANLDTLDAERLRADADAYIGELRALDAEVEATLASIPPSSRVLVTNHQVFSYFADRYDFEVIGTVIPVGSGTDGVSGQRLADLAALLRSEGVNVVFADRSSSSGVAETLAAEVGNVEVVELFSESLGEADSGGETYVDMVRSNALAIAAALSN